MKLGITGDEFDEIEFVLVCTLLKEMNPDIPFKGSIEKQLTS